jgi:hypothetical protein
LHIGCHTDPIPLRDERETSRIAPARGFARHECGHYRHVTITTKNTMRWRVARAAVVGAIALNILTLVWSFYASTRTIVIAAIVLAVIGAVLGGAVGWALAANRWSRWWSVSRTTRQGSIRRAAGDQPRPRN